MRPSRKHPGGMAVAVLGFSVFLFDLVGCLSFLSGVLLCFMVVFVMFHLCIWGFHCDSVRLHVVCCV